MNRINAMTLNPGIAVLAFILIACPFVYLGDSDIDRLVYNATYSKKLPNLPWSYSGWPALLVAGDTKLGISKLEKLYRPFCTSKTDGFKNKFMHMQVSTELPDGCSEARICNSTACIELGFGSFYFSRLFLRHTQDHHLGLSAPPNSSPETLACIRNKVSSVTECNTPAFCCKNKFIPFNLPGYRFCTPCPSKQTQFPLNLVDDECRQLYSTGDIRFDSKEVAAFLSNVHEIEPFLFRIFFAAFKAKTIFESQTNRTYGSFLFNDLYNGFAASKDDANTFQYLEMDTIPFDMSKELELARVLETQWIDEVKMIWRSVCYHDLLDQPLIYSDVENGLQQVEYHHSDLNFETCHFVQKLSRSTRAAVQPSYSKPKTGLSFTLPGFRYCGPGTNITEMDAAGGPVNKVDEACRLHDLAYSLAKTDEEVKTADQILLYAVGRSGSFLYPLFYAFFKAKMLYEAEFGSPYKIKTIYTMGNETPGDGTLNIWFTEEKEINEGIRNALYLDYHHAWQTSLRSVWWGSCIRQVMMQQQTAQTAEIPSSSQSSDRASKRCHRMDESESEAESEMEPKSGSKIWPIPDFPGKFGKCRVLINEILPMWSNNVFIELAKLCESGARGTYNSLVGFMLLIMDGDKNSEIVFTADLDNDVFLEVPDITGKHPRSSSFFVIGSFGTTQKNKNIMDYCSSAGQDKFVEFDDATYAVVLLYFPWEVRSKFKKKLVLPSNAEGRSVKMQVDPMKADILHILQTYTQDAIFFGHPCEDTSCDFFVEAFPVFQTNLVRGDPNEPDSDSQHLGWSLCDGNLPFQHQNFEIAILTPREDNICKMRLKLKHPFSLRGIRLQKSAQMLVVNAEHCFTELLKQGELPTLNSRTLTANCLNMGWKSVDKVLKNYMQSAIETPNRKRVTKCRVRGRIDSFDKDLIRRIIIGKYSKNTPALLGDVYGDFVKAKKEMDSSFECSQPTFSLLLKSLGYKYGRIDKRAAIVQREDIVQWRGKFLKRMLANDRLPDGQRWNVVYTDETWIDPFQRTDKGWIVRSCSFKEASKFSYKSQGAGGRIIVLSAGGEMGTIPGTTLVYAVKKGAQTADYHENVDSEMYLEWYEDMLRKLEEPSIIIMDNARYHSTSTAPKQKQTKHEIYEWLEKQKQEGFLAELKSEGEYRKFELWDLVTQLKTANNFYKVDNLAAEYGHEVVRLPPYNCDLNPIELVWKDLKHEVRKNNPGKDLNVIIELARSLLEGYDVSRWNAHVNHARRLCRQYWDEDGHVETVVSELRIVISDDDDDDDDDECIDEVTSGEGFEMQDDNLVPNYFDEDEEEALQRFFDEESEFPMRAPKCARRLPFHEG